MPFVKVGSENQADIDIHYNDHGTGSPVVLIHGYPLDGNSWERQERELLAAGYRCVSYDRRGFGRSSQPTVGYDYDTFAADLNALLEHLDLRDVVLCGFSMGTGEVTRYLGTYGSARVSKAALFGVIPPFLLKTDDNPEGVDGQVFEDIKAAIVKDRYAYFKDFLDNFYNVDVLGPDRISNQAWQASFNVAVGSSPYASYACVNTWLTDFREDLPKIDVPTLVMHGTEDRILPFESTAARLTDLIPDVRVVPVEGGPHNIGWTHPEEVNPALLEFLAGESPATAVVAAHAASV
jgi:non-heme chloroperoxidase